jgi:hypothetical protein
LPDGGLPGDHRSAIDTAGIFTLSSYEAILYGMDFLRVECDRWFGKNRPPSRVPPNIAGRLKMAANRLPTHEEWLRHVVGMPEYQVSG